MRALVLSAVVALSTTACADVMGSGTIVRSQPPGLPAFTEVELGGGLEATVRQGAPGVALEGDDNIVREYRVEVVGERLVIEPREGVSLSPSRPVKALVTLPVLRKVVASGGVQLLVESGVEQSLALELSGGVELKAGNLALAVLQVQASGGVDVALQGTAETADFDLSGGVEVHAKDLAAKTVLLDASGGCRVASGGVDVSVHGNPPKSRLQTSGGASIRWND
jgi:hypothetical protein